MKELIVITKFKYSCYIASFPVNNVELLTGYHQVSLVQELFYTLILFLNH